MQLQYIGARYVPIWYQNSIDQTANWEVNVQYEPMTFVTTPNDHLYLSKKEVPDNIGSPASNPDYWLDMGTYSGSYPAIVSRLDNLDNEVDEIFDRISGDILANKAIILQGDSYAVEDANGSWAYNVYTQLNDTTGLKVYKLATGGAGFLGATGGQTFLDAMQIFAPTVTNPDDITDIYLLGGYNDASISFTKNDIITAIVTYADYVKTVFPNAMIHIGCVAWGKRGENDLIAKTVIPAYMYGCTQRRNLTYINGSENINHNLAYIADAPDLIHPTTDGNDIIAGQLLNVIKGGEIDIYWDNLDTTFVPTDAGGATSGSVVLHTCQKNDITELVINSWNLIFISGLSGFTGQAYTGNFVKIGDLEDGCIAGYYENGEFSIMLPVVATIALGSTPSDFKTVPAWLCIANGGVYFDWSYLENGTPYGGNLYQMIITPSRYEIPTIKA